MELAHFYHVYASGPHWHEAAEEHVRELAMAGVPTPLHLGIVGSDSERTEVVSAFDNWCDIEIAAAARTGFEGVTQRALWEYVKTNDGAVMYAHTKGATTSGRGEWRKGMSDALIRPWRENLARLEGVTQAVGPMMMVREGIPFFAGNYWMARCDYLRTLPEPRDERWAPETWITGHKTPPSGVELMSLPSSLP